MFIASPSQLPRSRFCLACAWYGRSTFRYRWQFALVSTFQVRHLRPSSARGLGRAWFRLLTIPAACHLQLPIATPRQLLQSTGRQCPRSRRSGASTDDSRPGQPVPLCEGGRGGRGKELCSRPICSFCVRQCVQRVTVIVNNCDDAEIDVCTNNLAGCDTNADCNNGVCTCRHGYTGNGTYCEGKPPQLIVYT